MDPTGEFVYPESTLVLLHVGIYLKSTPTLSLVPVTLGLSFYEVCFFKNCFMYYSAITLDDILNGVTSSQYLSKGINTKNQPHLVSNLYIVLVDFDHC